MQKSCVLPSDSHDGLTPKLAVDKKAKADGKALSLWPVNWLCSYTDEKTIVVVNAMGYFH